MWLSKKTLTENIKTPWFLTTQVQDMFILLLCQIQRMYNTTFKQH